MPASKFSNNIVTFPIGIIAFICCLIIIGCAPEPTDWYVAKTGNDSNTCKSPDEACLTIQAAVDKAWKKDDRIFIAEGVFSERVFIEGKNLSISGQGPTNSIISGAGLCSPGDAGALVEIVPKNYEKVTLGIENLAIRDCKRGDWNVADEGGGLYAQYADLTLSDVLITGNRAYNGGGIKCEGCTLSLLYSTISNNSAYHNGGGVYMYGDLVAGATTFIGNNAFGDGGGLWHSGYGNHVMITDSIFQNNQARENGGGIFTFHSNTSLKIFKSTIDGNSARGGGGLGNGSITEIYESTISNNSALGIGGGISNNNQVILENCTLSGNQKVGIYNNTKGINISLMNVTLANNSGKGIFSNPQGQVSVQDSLFSNNGLSNCDIRGAVTAAGNMATDHSCPGSTVEPDVKIGPLAKNGGPTDTHALQPDSPAIDAALVGTGSVWQDQRENSRPLDGNGDGLILNDIGAYEYKPQKTLATLTPTKNIPIIYIPDKNQNCRTGPGTDWNIQGGLPAGTNAPVDGRNQNGTWVRVTSPDGKVCWVLVTTEIPGLGSIPVLPDPPKPFRPTEITAVPQQPGKKCSSYGTQSSCANAGCTWVFGAAGPGRCK